MSRRSSSKPQKVCADFTPFLRGAALLTRERNTELNVGQLVQDPDFTLFQAVGALEAGTSVLRTVVGMWG
jgi:hypothetical protein